MRCVSTMATATYEEPAGHEKNVGEITRMHDYVEPDTHDTHTQSHRLGVRAENPMTPAVSAAKCVRSVSSSTIATVLLKAHAAAGRMAAVVSNFVKEATTVMTTSEVGVGEQHNTTQHWKKTKLEEAKLEIKKWKVDTWIWVWLRTRQNHISGAKQNYISGEFKLRTTPSIRWLMETERSDKFKLSQTKPQDQKYIMETCGARIVAFTTQSDENHNKMHRIITSADGQYFYEWSEKGFKRGRIKELTQLHKAEIIMLTETFITRKTESAQAQWNRALKEVGESMEKEVTYHFKTCNCRHYCDRAVVQAISDISQKHHMSNITVIQDQKTSCINPSVETLLLKGSKASGINNIEIIIQGHTAGYGIQKVSEVDDQITDKATNLRIIDFTDVPNAIITRIIQEMNITQVCKCAGIDVKWRNLAIHSSGWRHLRHLVDKVYAQQTGLTQWEAMKLLTARVANNAENIYIEEDPQVSSFKKGLQHADTKEGGYLEKKLREYLIDIINPSIATGYAELHDIINPSIATGHAELEKSANLLFKGIRRSAKRAQCLDLRPIYVQLKQKQSLDKDTETLLIERQDICDRTCKMIRAEKPKLNKHPMHKFKGYDFANTQLTHAESEYEQDTLRNEIRFLFDIFTHLVTNWTTYPMKLTWLIESATFKIAKCTRKWQRHEKLYFTHWLDQYKQEIRIMICLAMTDWNTSIHLLEMACVRCGKHRFGLMKWSQLKKEYHIIIQNVWEHQRRQDPKDTLICEMIPSSNTWCSLIPQPQSRFYMWPGSIRQYCGTVVNIHKENSWDAYTQEREIKQVAMIKLDTATSTDKRTKLKCGWREATHIMMTWETHETSTELKLGNRVEFDISMKMGFFCMLDSHIVWPFVTSARREHPDTQKTQHAKTVRTPLTSILQCKVADSSRQSTWQTGLPEGDKIPQEWLGTQVAIIVANQVNITQLEHGMKTQIADAIMTAKASAREHPIQLGDKMILVIALRNGIKACGVDLLAEHNTCTFEMIVGSQLMNEEIVERVNERDIYIYANTVSSQYDNWHVNNLVVKFDGNTMVSTQAGEIGSIEIGPGTSKVTTEDDQLAVNKYNGMMCKCEEPEINRIMTSFAGNYAEITMCDKCSRVNDVHEAARCKLGVGKEAIMSFVQNNNMTETRVPTRPDELFRDLLTSKWIKSSIIQFRHRTVGGARNDASSNSEDSSDNSTTLATLKKPPPMKARIQDFRAWMKKANIHGIHFEEPKNQKELKSLCWTRYDEFQREAEETQQSAERDMAQFTENVEAGGLSTQHDMLTEARAADEEMTLLEQTQEMKAKQQQALEDREQKAIADRLQALDEIAALKAEVQAFHEQQKVDADEIEKVRQERDNAVEVAKVGEEIVKVSEERAKQYQLQAREAAALEMKRKEMYEREWDESNKSDQEKEDSANNLARRLNLDKQRQEADRSNQEKEDEADLLAHRLNLAKQQADKNNVGGERAYMKPRHQQSRHSEEETKQAERIGQMEVKVHRLENEMKIGFVEQKAIADKLGETMTAELKSFHEQLKEDICNSRKPDVKTQTQQPTHKKRITPIVQQPDEEEGKRTQVEDEELNGEGIPGLVVRKDQEQEGYLSLRPMQRLSKDTFDARCGEWVVLCQGYEPEPTHVRASEIRNQTGTDLIIWAENCLVEKAQIDTMRVLHWLGQASKWRNYSGEDMNADHIQETMNTYVASDCDTIGLEQLYGLQDNCPHMPGTAIGRKHWINFLLLIKADITKAIQKSIKKHLWHHMTRAMIFHIASTINSLFFDKALQAHEGTLQGLGARLQQSERSKTGYNLRPNPKTQDPFWMVPKMGHVQYFDHGNECWITKKNTEGLDSSERDWKQCLEMRQVLLDNVYRQGIFTVDDIEEGTFIANYKQLADRKTTEEYHRQDNQNHGAEIEGDIYDHIAKQHFVAFISTPNDTKPPNLQMESDGCIYATQGIKRGMELTLSHRKDFKKAHSCNTGMSTDRESEQAARFTDFNTPSPTHSQATTIGSGWGSDTRTHDPNTAKRGLPSAWEDKFIPQAGIVRHISPDRTFGFIGNNNGGPDVWFSPTHANVCLVKPGARIEQYDQVEYSVVKTTNGKYKAVKVTAPDGQPIGVNRADGGEHGITQDDDPRQLNIGLSAELTEDAKSRLWNLQDEEVRIQNVSLQQWKLEVIAHAMPRIARQLGKKIEEAEPRCDTCEQGGMVEIIRTIIKMSRCDAIDIIHIMKELEPSEYQLPDSDRRGRVWYGIHKYVQYKNEKRSCEYEAVHGKITANNYLNSAFAIIEDEIDRLNTQDKDKYGVQVEPPEEETNHLREPTKDDKSQQNPPKAMPWTPANNEHTLQNTEVLATLDTIFVLECDYEQFKYNASEPNAFKHCIAREMGLHNQQVVVKSVLSGSVRITITLRLTSAPQITTCEHRLENLKGGHVRLGGYKLIYVTTMPTHFNLVDDTTEADSDARAEVKTARSFSQDNGSMRSNRSGGYTKEIKGYGATLLHDGLRDSQLPIVMAEVKMGINKAELNKTKINHIEDILMIMAKTLATSVNKFRTIKWLRMPILQCVISEFYDAVMEKKLRDHEDTDMRARMISAMANSINLTLGGDGGWSDGGQLCETVSTDDAFDTGCRVAFDQDWNAFLTEQMDRKQYNTTDSLKEYFMDWRETKDWWPASSRPTAATMADKIVDSMPADIRGKCKKKYREMMTTPSIREMFRHDVHQEMLIAQKAITAILSIDAMGERKAIPPALNNFMEQAKEAGKQGYLEQQEYQRKHNKTSHKREHINTIAEGEYPCELCVETYKTYNKNTDLIKHTKRECLRLDNQYSRADKRWRALRRHHEWKRQLCKGGMRYAETQDELSKHDVDLQDLADFQKQMRPKDERHDLNGYAFRCKNPNCLIGNNAGIQSYPNDTKHTQEEYTAMRDCAPNRLFTDCLTEYQYKLKGMEPIHNIEDKDIEDDVLYREMLEDENRLQQEEDETAVTKHKAAP